MPWPRSEEHTSELQSRPQLVCRLLLEKKKPGSQALRVWPSRMPPARSRISWPLVPIGNSQSPGRSTSPEAPYNLVPLSVLRPPDSPRYQSAPCCMTAGTLHRVSTLLTTVGLPQAPDWPGNGGLARGLARLPSRELISAFFLPMRQPPRSTLFPYTTLFR